MAVPITVYGPKMTEHYEPYSEYCPKCQCNHTTRMESRRGNCWWIAFFIGFFLFFPICYWLCCQSSKDTLHYCPSCGTLLATRQGGCS